MRSSPNPSSTDGAFTMVELLLSMAILSLVVVGLADLFAFTARTWSRQVQGSAVRAALHDAVDQVQRDLECAYSNRPTPYPKFDPDLVSNEAQRYFFARSNILPFEIDRRSGLGLDQSFAYGEKSFSQIAFVGVQAGSGSLLPETFYPERHDKLAGASGGGGLRPTPSDVCLIGYYVAYTRDSTVSGDERWSMKLFRHLRPGGISLRQAQAGSTIRYVGETINKQLIPQRVFSNTALPYLLAYHSPSQDSEFLQAVRSQSPWPEGIANPPFLSMQRGSQGAWMDPNHAIHDALGPDKAIAKNVIRFVAKPFKRLRVGTGFRLLDAEGLSSVLELPGKEWPALVVPDFIDFDLALLDESSPSVLSLQSRSDWINYWNNRRPDQGGRSDVVSYKFRVVLHPNIHQS